MPPIPRDKNPDSTLALLSDGYRFISNRCERLRSDVFATRLMLTPAVCALGEEAAEVFYHPGRFTRRGAMPRTTLKLLQDEGSVAVLDGEEHHHRKRMFMALMTPDAIRNLADLMEDRWRTRLGRWETMEQVVLLPELETVIGDAVCAWCGVPLAPSELDQRTRELSAMIEGAGSFGPRGWRALLLRERTERWMRDVVARVRSGDLNVPEGSAVDVISRHSDLGGSLLEVEVAAVELINILRPTLAVGRFVTFAALALHEHPECRPAVEQGQDEDLERFVQEVRRFYPFFPLVAGRVHEAFDWRGRHFAQGTWVLLDLYGTDHDPRIWGDPERFRPERFREWNGSPFNFIPQGGGDHYANHRCPGEWITIALMKRAVRLLTTAMCYDVPPQDLTVDLGRMPTAPKSGFVIRNVSRIG
jgi:fatty-acid peroxygenase